MPSLVFRLALMGPLIAGVFIGGIYAKIAVAIFMLLTAMFSEIASVLAWKHDAEIKQLQAAVSARTTIQAMIRRLG